jgi:hypothetical protein
MEKISLTKAGKVPARVQKAHESLKKRLYVEINQQGAELMFHRSRGKLPYERLLDLTAIRLPVVRLNIDKLYDPKTNDWIEGPYGVVFDTEGVAKALIDEGYQGPANWWEGFNTGLRNGPVTSLYVGSIALTGDLFLGERE